MIAAKGALTPSTMVVRHCTMKVTVDDDADAAYIYLREIEPGGVAYTVPVEFDEDKGRGRNRSTSTSIRTTPLSGSKCSALRFSRQRCCQLLLLTDLRVARASAIERSTSR